MKKYNPIENIVYLYKRTFEYDKSFIWWIISYVMASVLSPICLVVLPAIVVEMITAGVEASTYIYYMGISIGIYGVITVVKTYVSQKLSWHSSFVRCEDFIMSYAEKTFSCDYEQFETYEGKTRAKKGLGAINNNWVGVELMLKNAPEVIVSIIGIIVYTVLAGQVNGTILLLLIAMTISNILINIYANRYYNKHKDELNKLYERNRYYRRQSSQLVTAQDVRIYAMNNWLLGIVKVINKKYIRESTKIQTRFMLPNMSDTIFLCLRDFVAYSVLTKSVLDGNISITEYTFMIGVIAGFSSWLNTLVESGTNVLRANIGLSDFRTHLDYPERFNHQDGLKAADITGSIEIELRNVSYRYPDFDHDVIKDLNLIIKPKEKLAVVGLNGAGKTTIVKLICGLYYPTQGQILINGHDIKEFNIDEYYQLISVLFQDVHILASDILSNVCATTRDKINMTQFWNSIRAAGLEEKILSLEKKEETMLTKEIDEDGILLSGGQMQRLMLARALYKDAPLLILDEPTAALDPIAELDLYKKYNDLTKDKTSFFISHRLSSTQFCDRIIYLENGCIVESGSHQELLAKKGKYASLFDVQSQYYKDGEVNENV